MSSYGTGSFFEDVVKEQEATKKWLRENLPKAPNQSDSKKNPYEALLDYREALAEVYGANYGANKRP